MFCAPATAAGQSATQNAAAGLRPETAEAIRGAVKEQMAALGIPGLSVAVADDFSLVFSEGFGMADLEHSVPATRDTVYRLASISKPITAVAALQLVERGRLDLDAPVRTYVPGFPEKKWPVTVRHLLTHTAGIRHYGSPEEVGSTRHYSDILEPLKIFESDPLLFEPGTKFSYTTYGYNLLGAAVEKAAGMPFMEYLKENVFGPAKMETARQDDAWEVVPHRARGYRMAAERRIMNCALADTSNKIPGGGMLATAEDLVRFAIAVERAALLKPETVKVMFTPYELAGGRKSAYALGWTVQERAGRTWVSHGGGQQGTATLLLTMPERGIAIAVTANLEGADVTKITDAITNILLQ
ncbi:MAG TPA: serine hydrolase domain-containing protein [Bryobacteraceae bacterium]|nr:serine hydrolase domain-containing protein [Bryobacteraceae bacterium]